MNPRQGTEILLLEKRYMRIRGKYMQRKSVFKTIKLMTAATVIALCIFIPAKSKVIAAEPVNQYLQLDNNGWRYYSNNQLDTHLKAQFPMNI